MLGYARSRAALWCASLAGAVLFASSIAALADPASAFGIAPYLGTILKEIPGVIGLDPGLSLVTRAPAFATVQPALMLSLQLLLGAAPVALILGSGLALLLSWRPAARGGAGFIQLARSVPLFCTALFVAALAGAAGPEGDATGLVMPVVLTIGLAGAGAVALFLKGTLEALSGADGNGLARFGLKRGAVMRRYLLRPAFATALEHAGDIMLALFAAAAVVEWIFGWPGAGAAFITSVALTDWNVVAVLIMVLAAARFTLDLAGALLAFLLVGDE